MEYLNRSNGRRGLSGLRRGAMAVLMLAGLACAQPGEMGGRHGDGPGIEAVSPMLMRELGLTTDQQKKLKETHLAVQKRKIQMQSDKAIIELDLKSVLSTYPVNVSEAMKLGEKMAGVEHKLVLLRVEAWSQFLAGLTADQHAKLMDLQMDLRERHRDSRKGSEGPKRGRMDHDENGSSRSGPPAP